MELRERILAAEDKQRDTDAITNMDQSYRLNAVRVEEHNARISARLTRQESSLEDTRLAATATNFTRAMDKRLSTTITETAGTLTNIIRTRSNWLLHKQHADKVAKEQLELAQEIQDSKVQLMDTIHAAREAGSAAISAARTDAKNAQQESVTALNTSLDAARAAAEAKHTELVEARSTRNHPRLHEKPRKLF